MNMPFRGSRLALPDTNARTRAPVQLAVPLQEIATRVFASPTLRSLRHVAVAGAMRQVGASFVARNLTDSFGAAGHRVLLIEVVHDLPPRDDLPALLSAPAQASAELPLVVRLGASDVLPLVAPGSDTFAQMTDHLEDRFDIVVWDLPPPAASSPTALVAAEMDGAILVVRADRTTRRQLAFAAERMRDNGATMLGVVMNQVVRRLPRWLERP